MTCDVNRPVPVEVLAQPSLRISEATAISSLALGLAHTGAPCRLLLPRPGPTTVHRRCSPPDTQTVGRSPQAWHWSMLSPGTSVRPSGWREPQEELTWMSNLRGHGWSDAQQGHSGGHRETNAPVHTTVRPVRERREAAFSRCALSPPPQHRSLSETQSLVVLIRNPWWASSGF